ncbi:CPBP family intramembrane glutamic endopeptidase [Halorubrum halophilum]|uniref:CPBP family intramembrane glutamic endopeptidase n=1 Tax=Halorubrum halophilum TaxID=413816 RepID=UPI00186AEE09|nr:type II CAAX endopeptidase family protein [Halorubrum halophilum]
MAIPDPTRIDAPPAILIQFFGLTFLLSWGAFLPVVFGLVPVASATPLVIASIFGPTIAALVLTWRADGSTGLQRLLARLVRVRVPIRWFVAALLPVGLGLLGWWVLYLTAGAGPLGQFGGDLGRLPTPIIVALFLVSSLGSGALAEELGWRGYALPRLQARFDALGASLLLGAVWAVWHLPVFLLTDAGTTLPFGWYLPRLLALSVLLTWVFDHTRGSVLHAVLLHAAVNGTEAFVSASLDTPLLELRYGQAMTLLTVAAALVVIVVWGWELGDPRQPTVGDAQER